MNSPLRFALLATCAMGTACGPFPHSAQLSPEISGVVTNNGQPVVGARILVSGGMTADRCVGTTEVALTSSDGTFRASRRTVTRFVYEPLVFPISVAIFSVCVGTGEKVVLGYRGFVRQGNADTITIKCDLGSPKLGTAHDGKAELLACQ